MAVDAFMWFKGAKGDIGTIKGETIDKHIKDNLPTGSSADAGTIFNIKSYDFGVENSSTLSSQSGGAGGGKCNMANLAINKAVDMGSPLLFQACAIGTHIEEATIVVRKAGGTSKTNKPYLRFWFKAVFIAGVTWSISGEDPIGEAVQIMYGALQIDYWKQKSDGTLVGTAITAHWNQVNNQNDHNPLMNED